MSERWEDLTNCGTRVDHRDGMGAEVTELVDLGRGDTALASGSIAWCGEEEQAG